MLLTLQHLILILLELLINLMEMMRTEAPTYFRIVLLIYLDTWLNLIVMIMLRVIAEPIQCCFILVEEYLWLMMIIALRIIVMELRGDMHISVDIRISYILVFFSHIIQLLLLILLRFLQLFCFFFSLSSRFRQLRSAQLKLLLVRKRIRWRDFCGEPIRNIFAIFSFNISERWRDGFLLYLNFS